MLNDYTSTNNLPLQVQMALKPDIVYFRGRSMSVSPSHRMVIGLDDEKYPEYVPPGTRTQKSAARTTRGTPKKVSSDIVSTSEYDEECILIDTPSRSAAPSVVASRSYGDSTLSDEADSEDATPAPSSTPLHRLLISPTGGAYKANTSCTGMRSCSLIRGS